MAIGKERPVPPAPFPRTRGVDDSAPDQRPGKDVPAAVDETGDDGASATVGQPSPEVRERAESPS